MRCGLTLTALLTASGRLSAGDAAAATPSRPVGAYGSGDDDGFGVAALGRDGAPYSAPLPGRAHDVVVRPGASQLIVIARRPGRFAVCCRRDDLRPLQRFETAPTRHFYGHGVFDGGGERLFTSENDYRGERGVIGVRAAAADYRQIDEWPSGGIGPHQIGLGADGATLVVANGGILTHPDSGRAKLNIPTMRSTLARLDAADGTLLARRALGAGRRYLSIRHIVVTAADDVVFGVQNEGPPDRRLPLVGVWRADDRLQWFDAVDRLRHGYIGSVAVDTAQRIVAASAPRDHLVAFYTLDQGRLLTTLVLEDGCGLAAAASAGEFWLSSGGGELLRVAVDQRGVTIRARYRLAGRWDNHLTRT